jgi:dTDP-4-dehydrorhamnose 3,5-epimerase
MHEGKVSMKVENLALAGLKLITLKLFGDSRGFFVERFKENVFAENGLPTHFAQDNHSRSAPGILRGLHYQTEPAQGKLIGVVRGRIWDVAVDIRAGSPTFGQHFSVELSDMNGKLLWVPAGFAHGFCVIGEEPADVYYKVDGLYNPATEGGIRWDDPDLGVKWPEGLIPQISGRDEKLATFRDYRANPAF